MREMKFRAWDKKLKEMLEVKDLSWRINVGCTSKRPSEIGASDFGDYDEVTYTSSIADGWELMQYTGLKDKNGKEIYEGDIVKGWHYEDMDTGVGIDRLSIPTTTFAVEWDNETCGWNLYGSDDFEVIGNIYENSELV